uniref:mitochondrial fission 1 protein-like n=1 Tax=Styela clava TaxID=7725 RepID=UPI0019392E5D|nr:mitochondrial fission 1 protein-like [Styela clava]
MEEIINEVIATQDIMKFERKYKKEEAIGKVEATTQFEYAWCLVRSQYKNDWKKGVVLLEELYHTGDNHAKRDYIFYISIAHYKLKNYEQALKFCKAILHVEPQNHQAKQLEELIKKTEKKEAMAGMAIVGGAGLVVGVGVAALGVLAAVLASRSK